LPQDAYQDFRENALLLARQRFDIKANVDVWIRTYQAIINSKSTG